MDLLFKPFFKVYSATFFEPGFKRIEIKSSTEFGFFYEIAGAIGR